MPELRFAVDGADAEPFAASPTLRFALRIDVPGGEPIRSISLDAQVRIAVARRAYDRATRERLVQVLGEPERAANAVPGLFWTHTTIVVPAFERTTAVGLPVACTYDLEVAATSYLDALGDGDVPLELLFSGTVFYAAENGFLRAERIPWDREARFDLPVATWRRMMDHYFPNSGWLRVRRDVLGRLRAYKARSALPTWDDALDALLRAREEGSA